MVKVMVKKIVTHILRTFISFFSIKKELDYYHHKNIMIITIINF